MTRSQQDDIVLRFEDGWTKKGYQMYAFGFVTVQSLVYLGLV